MLNRSLSKRQFEIATWASHGFSNKQIANDILHIGKRTVERQMHVIFKKQKSLFDQFPGENKRVLLALLIRSGRIPYNKNHSESMQELFRLQRNFSRGRYGRFQKSKCTQQTITI